MSRKLLLVLILLLVPSLLVRAVEDDSKTSAAKLKRLLEDVKKKRLQDVENQAKSIDSAKATLKTAMLADNRDAISAERMKIASLQTALSKTIDSPISVEPLSPTKLKTGQVGLIQSGRFSVAQILDKAKGEILVSATINRDLVFLKVVGVDADNLVDDAKFSFSGCVAVVGTYTYGTVGGNEKTIFELHACPTTLVFTDTELKPFQEAIDAKYSIALTESEKAKMKITRDTNEKLASDRKAVLNEQQRMKDDDAKLSRSKSYLDNGKILLKNGKTDSAKKLFEKAIAEYPESVSAKEAKKLLDKTP